MLTKNRADDNWCIDGRSRKILFDMDFSAPDKTRDGPPRGGNRAKDRIRRARALSRRLPTPRSAEAKAESDRRTALALSEIGCHSRHRDAASRH